MDLQSLAALHEAAVTAGYRHIFAAAGRPPTARSLTAGWHALLGERDSHVIVAEAPSRQDDTRLIGSVVVAVDPSVPTGRLLKRLHVHPAHWGQGAGTALHDHALDVARSAGASDINLWVLEQNTRARGMYERRGWVLVEPRRTFANEPPHIVDVLYQRSLLIHDPTRRA